MERDYYGGRYEGGDSWEPEEKEGRLRSALQRAMGSLAVYVSDQANKVPFIKRLREPWLTIDFPNGPDPFLEDEIMRILELQEESDKRGGNQSR